MLQLRRHLRSLIFQRVNFPAKSFWSKKIVRKIILSCAMLCAVIFSMWASPVWAQNVLWVGPSGSDSNVCSQTSPCATFQGAINKGSVDQINCHGSGLYGAVTITASITIDCGAGNVGNIVNSSAAGITINTTAAATIILRHLAISGLNLSGIDARAFFSGTLIVEDCMIRGYDEGAGIIFEPQSGRGLLQVSNSQMFSNANGILIAAAIGQIASVTLNRVELVGNIFTGLALGGNVVAGTMRNSIAGENGQYGILGSATQIFFTIEESSVVDNLTSGIFTNTPGSMLNVGSSTIGGNGTGVMVSAGSIISFGNNQMGANAVNGTFTSKTPLQ
jgi:hypothetical protein